MTLWERISKQLAHPSGLGGQLIMRLMNRGNAGMNAAAIERVGAESDRRILDLGFGGGLSFEPLLDRGASVAGVDRATDVVAAARRNHRGAIESGRLEVTQGEVSRLPFEDASFDGVLTVNTIYFWPGLDAAMSEVRRVLKPGGRVVVAIRDPAAMKRVSADVFILRPPAEVLAAIEAAGFVDAASESPKGESFHLISASSPSG